MIEVAEHVALGIVLLMITAHHVLEWADRLFGGPRWLVQILHKHRAAQIHAVLNEIGFDGEALNRIKASHTRWRIGKAARYTDPQARCITLLRSCVWKRSVKVGSGVATEFPYFVDLMSRSLDTDQADECAYILSSHINSNKASIDHAFDAVIGLKLGSPLIAAAFAEKVRKPLILYRGRGNYKIDSANAPYLFDGPVGDRKVGVLVDDSTTGGKLALDCIEAAKDAGITIEQCWVLFEPIGKQAREKLKAQGVELISVVQMTPKVVKQVLA